MIRVSAKGLPSWRSSRSCGRRELRFQGDGTVRHAAETGQSTRHIVMRKSLWSRWRPSGSVSGCTHDGRADFMAPRFLASWLIAFAVGVSGGSAWAAKPATELLNASYDVSRELFTQINPAFVAQWKSSTGQAVVIRQSHGGSSARRSWPRVTIASTTRLSWRGTRGSFLRSSWCQSNRRSAGGMRLRRITSPTVGFWTRRWLRFIECACGGSTAQGEVAFLLAEAISSERGFQLLLF